MRLCSSASTSRATRECWPSAPTTSRALTSVDAADDAALRVAHDVRHAEALDDFHAGGARCAHEERVEHRAAGTVREGRGELRRIDLPVLDREPVRTHVQREDVELRRIGCGHQVAKQTPAAESEHALRVDQMSGHDVAGEARPVDEQHVESRAREQHRRWCSRHTRADHDHVMHVAPRPTRGAPDVTSRREVSRAPWTLAQRSGPRTSRAGVRGPRPTGRGTHGISAEICQPARMRRAITDRSLIAGARRCARALRRCRAA